jgi:hypothetical protein
VRADRAAHLEHAIFLWARALRDDCQWRTVDERSLKDALGVLVDGA